MAQNWENNDVFQWGILFVKACVCVTMCDCAECVYVFVSVSATVKQQSWQAHHQPLVAHQGQLDIVRQP